MTPHIHLESEILIPSILRRDPVHGRLVEMLRPSSSACATGTVGSDKLGSDDEVRAISFFSRSSRGKASRKGFRVEVRRVCPAQISLKYFLLYRSPLKARVCSLSLTKPVALTYRCT